MFDEMGSVYAHDIILVEQNSNWVEVEHTEKQVKLKQSLAVMGW